ncbi:glycine zipper domain-containing protein [Serratia rhizosphaerae]|uniref:CsbD family protein n=1 Tax=Serratia rhizosphaerae TaxID=2597702 RepID=A0ABX6GGW6_9GAMM|nr:MULTISPECIES: CsbD family protein [Serratia]MCA4822255.1 CsbD family protein [Serratia rubidaea]AVJ17327.1 CsbD family protein [Serratia sp. MYb239]MEB6335538.1 CsbD family protein [Serratia rhizosphaerae]QHA85522.1 CsbD family protein [Serratia rhizosphaerae]QNK30804.1 CsbD family protein [Serratia sp. JUb9]
MFGKAEDKAKEVAGAAQEAFGEATGSPEHEIKGAARKYASQASYAVRDGADVVRHRVESNPLAGVAVAAAVGVVFGYLLGRK